MSTRLKPIQPWEALWRSAFAIDRHGHTWTVGVHYLEDEDKAIRLYRDGEFLEQGRSPARFELPAGAVIEVATTFYKLKHVRLVDGGEVVDLQPVPGSAEAWRARLAREYPKASRVADTLSWTVLLVAFLTQVPQLIGLVAGLFGVTVPFGLSLPGWLNTTLSFLGLAAAVDRSLSMKYNPWID